MVIHSTMEPWAGFASGISSGCGFSASLVGRETQLWELDEIFPYALSSCDWLYHDYLDSPGCSLTPSQCLVPVKVPLSPKVAYWLVLVISSWASLEKHYVANCILYPQRFMSFMSVLHANHNHLVSILQQSYLFIYWDWFSLCSPSSPGTHSVDQAGLKISDLPASASQVLRLKVCDTTPS